MTSSSQVLIIRSPQAGRLCTWPLMRSIHKKEGDVSDTLAKVIASDLETEPKKVRWPNPPHPDKLRPPVHQISRAFAASKRRKLSDGACNGPRTEVR